MQPRGRKSLAIILLLAVTGVQWMVLQSAAWTGMLLARLPSQSITTAVCETFDGHHPCPLCRAIQKARGSEKKSDQPILIPRLVFLPACVAADLILPGKPALDPPSNEFSDSLPSPPVPPPPRSC